MAHCTKRRGSIWKERLLEAREEGSSNLMHIKLGNHQLFKLDKHWRSSGLCFLHQIHTFLKLILKMCLERLFGLPKIAKQCQNHNYNQGYIQKKSKFKDQESIFFFLICLGSHVFANCQTLEIFHLYSWGKKSRMFVQSRTIYSSLLPVS